MTHQSCICREPPWVQHEQGKADPERGSNECGFESFQHDWRIHKGLHFVVMFSNPLPNRWLWCWAVALGLLLCVALMGSNMGALNSSLPGYFNDDAINGVYLHHQVHAALVEFRFDLSDPQQFHPIGYNPVHTNGGNILEMLVSGAMRLVLPWPSWMGVAGLLWIPINMLAFIPLARRLWRDSVVVLAASATWAMFPPVLAQLSAGRWTQAALVGVPIAILGFLDVVERGGKRSILVAAGGLALTGLGYWFNALFVVILLPVFLWMGRKDRSITAVSTDLMVAANFALIFVLPMLLIIFWPVFSGGSLAGTHIETTSMNPVFPDALQLIGGQGKGLVGWLPWVFIPGIVLTLFKGQRRGLWLGLAGLCVLFSLGPAQEVSGDVWRSPYWVLWKFVPGLSRMFHPDRWMLVGGLFLTILACDGVARWRPRWVVILPIGLLAQLWVDGVSPLPVWTPTVPDHWSYLSQDREQGAVIVVPIQRSQLSSGYQPFHGRPLLGGMVEDQPWAQPEGWREYVEASPFLLSLRRLSHARDVAIALEKKDISQLRADGFTTVVFDQLSWNRLPFAVRFDPKARLEAALGPADFVGDQGAVWSLSE